MITFNQRQDIVESMATVELEVAYKSYRLLPE